jgi:hypothetical protein
MSFLPLGNPPARIGYACAWLGLVPGLGLLFGGPALVFGLLGRRHAKRDAEGRGRGHAFVCQLAGIVEILSNTAGWLVLAKAYDLL